MPRMYMNKDGDTEIKTFVHGSSEPGPVKYIAPDGSKEKSEESEASRRYFDEIRPSDEATQRFLQSKSDPAMHQTQDVLQSKSRPRNTADLDAACDAIAGGVSDGEEAQFE